MATYKQPCIHCHTLIDRDVRFCPNCGSQSPFGYLCPHLPAPNHEKSKSVRRLRTAAYGHLSPPAEKLRFVQETCEQCGQSLMIRCENRRCQAMQFFQNEKCTACGKRFK